MQAHIMIMDVFIVGIVFTTQNATLLEAKNNQQREGKWFISILSN